MNIHPIFVHFPIALLTIYSVMEIFQFKLLRDSRGWQLVKSWFAILGGITAVIAYQTGDLATEGLVGSPLINVHSNWASATVAFFGIMAAFYVVRLVNTESLKIKDWAWNAKYIRNVWMVLSKISDWVVAQWWALVLLGVVGILLISIAGALGGAIAYGPNADPVVSFVYNLFF